MGWGSGSLVMADIMAGLREEVPQDDLRERIYQVVIRALEASDWDTQDECMGSDPAFDRALRAVHPDWFES